MGSFGRLAVVTASTKRMGAVVDGLTGDLAVHIASLRCLPLDPVTPEVAMMAGLDAFAEVLQTMVEGGLDILEGDVFVVGSTEHKVRAVGQWSWRPTAKDTLLILLEEVK
jgi:hypothetical protein